MCRDNIGEGLKQDPDRYHLTGTALPRGSRTNDGCPTGLLNPNLEGKKDFNSLYCQPLPFSLRKCQDLTK